MKDQEGDDDEELAQPLTDFYGHLATPVNLALYSMTWLESDYSRPPHTPHPVA
jgi:hypothetical protein